MEQDRFDALAKKVFDGSSRRRVIGGALASVVGAGVAAVAGTSAKDKGKGRAKAQGKNKKGKAKGEFVCTAANANAFCPPQSCCQSTPGGVTEPTCVGLAEQIQGGVVGDAGGGNGVCISCPTGTRADVVTGRCICTASSCPGGCCIDNTGLSSTDQCIANGSGAPVNSVNLNVDGAFVCGVNGVSCDASSSFCGDTFFGGCCTPTGICSAGTSNANCGGGGGLCTTCQNDSSCGIDQACTGGTTTTTTTTAAPTTTTAAPCGFNKNNLPKVTCGTKCCGPKKGCNGAGTKCKK